MLLNRFNGGLNTREAPELISPLEAIEMQNADIHAGSIKALANLAVSSTFNTIKAFYSVSLAQMLPNADTRDYLDYQGKVYWTDGSLPKKLLQGVEQNLGIVAPTQSGATLGGVGVLTGTLQYVYTYYNILDGTESMPSPITLDVIATNQQVNIAITKSLDPQVTNVFLYRIGGNFTAFTKVKELLNVSQLYSDNIADADLAVITLTSQTNDTPPNGLKFLVEEYGTFFAALGSKLYYSRDIGNPNYWPATNQIDFHDTITGIATTTIGIVVFTSTRCFGLSGSVTGGFRKFLLSSTQGCIEHHTIQGLNGSLLFVSTDGICGLRSTGVTVLTRPKLGKLTLAPVNAVTFDDVYYCQLQDGKLLVVDTRYQPAIYYVDMQTQWLITALDHLYAERNSLVYECFQGSPLSYIYHTGNLTEGSIVGIKIYSTVYISLIGTVKITILIDEVPVIAKTLTGQVLPSKIGLPQLKQRGTSISFRLEGTGTVKGIFYSMEMQQNA